MPLNLHLPESLILKPRITVFGVGGAGGNAVNNMISAGLEGVNFVAANTDAQALENSLTENRVQLGEQLTRGLGAGAKPDVGAAAAEEARTEIEEYMQGCNMVFITAGMGGGTGTGASRVICGIAKEKGVLTVGVVTKPFHFEGAHRMRLAEQGVQELQSVVDTLIIIPNQNLFRIANEKTTFADAFKMADSVLHAGVRGITDLMTMPGLINLDFADICAVMGEMGKAMMGTGEAEGENRATEAAEAAIANPLLDNVSMQGARGVLINITGGGDMTLFEVDEAANRIREEVDPNANIIFGSAFNPALEGFLRVSVVATGIDAEQDIKFKQQQQELSSSTPLQTKPVMENLWSESEAQRLPQLSQRPVAHPDPVQEEASLSPASLPKPPLPHFQPQPQPSVTYQMPEAAPAEGCVAPYQPQTVRHQVECEGAETLVAEEPSHFVAPKPQEPAFGISEAMPELEEAPAVLPGQQKNSRIAAERPQQQQASQQIKMGLFGRVAAGMGLGRHYDGDLDLTDPEKATAEKLVKDELGKAEINENIIDIPAYLRRRSDNSE